MTVLDMPDFEAEALALARVREEQKGMIKPGGCCVTEDGPEWHCWHCGRQW